MDLPTLWAGIIAFAIMLYVVLDGFDLGIGLVFPSFEVGTDRDKAINSIAPVWDGNETWLVLGGGGLLAAFPLAYSVILSALYIPILLMLGGLILRGVAFEFRWRNSRHQRRWDRAFSTGSWLAVLSQGLTLGALLEGIDVEGRSFAGGVWDWFSLFSLLTAVSLCIGYGLLGCCWLILKTDGSAQDKAYRMAYPLSVLFVLCIGLVSLATPFLEGAYYTRWFSFPGIIATMGVPLAVVITTFLLLRSLSRRSDRQPFVCTLILFALSFLGLGISIWPDIVPGAISIQTAAAPDESLSFMLVGAIVLLPTTFAYTAWAYWVFRGKVSETGFH